MATGGPVVPACFVILPVALAVQPEQKKPPTPESVQSLLDTKGGPETIRVLFDNAQQWDAILDGIATGRREWLVVAQHLSPFTDAHSSETLGMAIEEALVKAPELTLQLFGAGACQGFGFSSQAPESLAQVQAEIAKRKRAVGALRKSTLAAVKQDCLQLLEATEKSAPGWEWFKKE